MDDRYDDKKRNDEDLIKVSGGTEQDYAYMRVQIRSQDMDSRNTQNGKTQIKD